VKKWKWYYNLFITFLISGLWHGAEWTFVIWGALHGFYLIFAIWTANIRNKINGTVGLSKNKNVFKVVQVITTFVLVYFSWIFFRANNTADAFLIIKKTFMLNSRDIINLFEFKVDFYIALTGIALLMIIEIFEERLGLYERMKKMARPLKWAILIILIITVFYFGVWESSDFLYFQF
jgi:D-alanyl-lipoteichoic acid acyltransferase DltB (MBOAT superfamily)